MGDVLLQLEQASRSQLAKFPESGMGYFLALARLPRDLEDTYVIVAGNDYVVPSEAHPSYYSLLDVLAGKLFPAGPPLQISTTLSTPAGRNVAALPPGYVPAMGAVSLLGSVVLTSKARFYRFTGTAVDHRFNGSHLAVDTYLTTQADHTYANSGFAAVGRYALPIPVPASYVHVYELLAGTSLLVGTVLPNFGQAGGGVEVKTPSPGAGPAATLIHSAPINDF
jgi:hypothetical protein